MLRELTCEGTPGLDVEGAVDRLVRHLQLRIAGVGVLEPSGDLLRGPRQFQLRDDQPPQPHTAGQLGDLGTSASGDRVAIRPCRPVVRAPAVGRDLA
jgi:hypothetical protein